MTKFRKRMSSKFSKKLFRKTSLSRTKPRKSGIRRGGMRF